jgi:hypothetical protein
VVKRVILGRAMRSDNLGETLLPKRLALPVFASDALSSVAYAPDEIFLTLGLAGGALALTHSWEIALAVVVVMAVVIASYRQNVRAYPSGGGDYEVASVNLGPKAGLGVGSALLVDYVLTVAVSISSGVQNAAAAFGFVRGTRGARRGPPHRGPDRDEPAGGARVGHGVRDPDLPVHGDRARHGAHRGGPQGSPEACPRPRVPGSSCCLIPATTPSPGWPWPSCSCARSPPGAPPSPGSRRSATGCRRSASPRARTRRRRCCSWA